MWPGAAPAPIHEIIRGWTEDGGNRRVVDFVSLSHPVIHGYVLNTVERIDDASCKLTFAMRWTRKGDAAPDAKLPFANAQEGIAAAVRKTKALCEA